MPCARLKSLNKRIAHVFGKNMLGLFVEYPVSAWGDAFAADNTIALLTVFWTGKDLPVTIAIAEHYFAEFREQGPWGLFDKGDELTVGQALDEIEDDLP